MQNARDFSAESGPDGYVDSGEPMNKENDLRFIPQKPNTEPSGDVVSIGIATEPIAEDDTDLVEEMSATTILNVMFDKFIVNVSDWFNDLKYTSENGNPVKTHIEILAIEEDILGEAYHLRNMLIEDLAKRGEEITQIGGLLRTQVIDSTETEEEG